MVNGKWIIVFLLLLCSCQQGFVETNSNINFDKRKAEIAKAKEEIVPFFKPMKIQEGDWLESFNEDGQTFEQYLKANPTLPTSERQTIYIQPIGKFTENQKKVFQLTADYMKNFYNLPVKLNEITSLGQIPKDFQRRNPLEKHLQLKTSYFLDDLLPKILPIDAAAFICFTNYDLYPDENWNYVFGQATLKNRVGVWSLWRFGEDFELMMMRTLKIAMHETGHMFSLLHCTKYECLMSGVNHLGETDHRPLDVCPECMAKISWAMNYEPTLRYQNLSKFWKNQGYSDLEKEFKAKAEAVSKVTTK